jgi:hypothetical protein
LDEDYPGSSWAASTDGNVEKVEELTRKNRRSTVSDTVDKLGISHGSVHKIVYKECNSEKLTRDGSQEN